MKRYIDLDLEKCSACGACAVACMDQNDIDIQTEIPFRHVFMAVSYTHLTLPTIA